jgi:hypothetical protein
MVLICGLGLLEENHMKDEGFATKQLWSSSENTSQARMNWDDCTMPKTIRGFHLTSL